MKINLSEKAIIEPILSLLHSRKFILALTVIVVAIVTHIVPATLPFADFLTYITLFLLGAVGLHLSAEDLIVLKASLPTTLEQAERDAVGEIANVVVPGTITNNITTNAPAAVSTPGTVG